MEVKTQNMNRKFISNSNYVLRKLLNSEDCLEILKDFIESILDLSIKEIQLNPYLIEKNKYLPKEENFGIADVRIKTKENEEINIGIQFIDGIYIQTKMLMYYAQIHLNQLEYGNKREFAKTITINILDFKYFSSQEYKKIIRIKSNEIDIKLEELEIVVIELPKFNIKNEENITKKEEWISYLKGCNNKTLEKIKQQHLADNTPVIALTADAIVGARDNYIKEGFSDYLSKPVMYDALEAVIRENLDGKKILNETQISQLEKNKSQAKKTIILAISESPEELRDIKALVGDQYKGVYVKDIASAEKYLAKQ